jgi:hypothetical protein
MRALPGEEPILPEGVVEVWRRLDTGEILGPYIQRDAPYPAIVIHARRERGGWIEVVPPEATIH